MARRHGSMRRKNYLSRNMRQGLAETYALFLHAAANRLQHYERTVSLVQVENSRCDTHGSKRLVSFDSQQYPLPDAHASIAPVQTRCELSVFRIVSFHVGIEQN